MKSKVDKGFEFVYWNLSYRRKFIRTLWITPLGVLVSGYAFFRGNDLFVKIIFPIALLILNLCQLIYNYIKWKKDEVKESLENDNK